MLTALRLAGLLAVAWLGREACRRLRLPGPVGLTLSGAALALGGLSPQTWLPHGGLYTILLPPLVFEAAILLDLTVLWPDRWLLFTLAVPGVAFTMALIGGVLWRGFGWTPEAAFLFGALISATDPVAVIALFRTLRVAPRLAQLIEAESLFNDATAAILFTLALAVVAGARPGLAALPPRIAVTLGASLLVGLGLGCVASHLPRRLWRGAGFPLSLVLAYAVFLGAQALHGSGVLASLLAGGWLARAGIPAANPRLRRLWDKTGALANAAIFLILGGLVAAHWRLAADPAGWLAMAVTLLARAMLVYPVCAIAARMGESLSRAAGHVLVWGGMRGALALSLALAVPSNLPGRDATLSATLVAVLFSVFGQGLSLGRLVRRHLAPPLLP